MAAERRAARASRRTLAVAASVAAHAAFVVLLVWRLGSPPDVSPATVMNVVLTPFGHHDASKPATEPKREPPGSEMATASSPAHADERPKPAAPGDRKAEGVVEPPASGLSDGMRQALRGLLGCERATLLDLSPEERQRCRDRTTAEAARLRGVGAPKLNLDKGGEFAAGKSPEPYLARRPRNGCKTRAGGDVAPMGEEGVALGLACAWSF